LYTGSKMSVVVNPKYKVPRTRTNKILVSVRNRSLNWWRYLVSKVPKITRLYNQML
jgi:hypothetical protein